MTCLCDHPDEHLMLPGQSGHEFIRRLIGFGLLPARTRLSTLTSIWAHKKRAPQTCSALERFTKMSALRGVSASRPLRSLNASRINTGTGKWLPERFLTDIVWLRYLEPGVLRHIAEVTWPTHGKDTHVDTQPIFLPATVTSTVPQSSRLLALLPTGRIVITRQSLPRKREQPPTSFLLFFHRRSWEGQGLFVEIYETKNGPCRRRCQAGLRRFPDFFPSRPFKSRC